MVFTQQGAWSWRNFPRIPCFLPFLCLDLLNREWFIFLRRQLVFRNVTHRQRFPVLHRAQRLLLCLLKLPIYKKSGSRRACSEQWSMPTTSPNVCRLLAKTDELPPVNTIAIMGLLQSWSPGDHKGRHSYDRPSRGAKRRRLVSW